MKRGMVPRLTALNDKLLAQEGRNVHKISWQLFPDAVNAHKTDINSSAQYTKELLENPQNKTILEASFITDGYSVRADILRKNNEGAWDLFEIKSGSKYKLKYVHDMAFTSMVMEKAGVKTGQAFLMHLSNDYRLGIEISKLFKSVDCTERVELKKLEYLSVFDKACEEIESDKMPEPFLKRSCKNCPVFDECMGRGVQHHIFDLPRLSIPAIEELVALGADIMEKVPVDFELTEMQQIVKNSVLTNTTYISPNLKTELDNIKKPYCYLDFESVTTIMPLYPNIGPHTQLLTQFSIDKTDGRGNVLNHYDYIADHTKDCRREIAEKLIEDLGEEGSIITYANFEKIAVERLGGLFPDLCGALTKIAERIVDFEAIVRKNYYDVNFHGKSSIKKVLPVMIPEMSYKDLEIGEGGDASAAFAYMAMGMYDENTVAETKRNLLKYCAQDTMAMIKMHQFLMNIIDQ